MNQEDIDDDTTGDACDVTDDRDNPLAVAVESTKSSAAAQDPTGLTYDVCINKELTYAFTLKNAGQASWQPSGDGANDGTKVSLQTASGAADPITGQNTAPLPAAVNVGSSRSRFRARHRMWARYVAAWRMVRIKRAGLLDSRSRSRSSSTPRAAHAAAPARRSRFRDPVIPHPISRSHPERAPSDETDPAADGGAGGANGPGNAKGGSGGIGGNKAPNRGGEPGTVEDQGGCQASAARASGPGALGLLGLAGALPLLRRRRQR